MHGAQSTAHSQQRTTLSLTMSTMQGKCRIAMKHAVCRSTRMPSANADILNSGHDAGKLTGLDKELSKSLESDLQKATPEAELSISPVGPLAEASRCAAPLVHCCMRQERLLALIES